MKRLGTFSAAFALILSVCGDITTNDVMPDITEPTTWLHVTNTVCTTADVSIGADLTFDDRTFYRLSGNGYISGRRAVISVAPGVDDVLVTVQGYSGFFPAYRNSGNSANAWRNVGLDPWDKNTPTCYYDLRMGVKNGAAGSTGQAKFLLKTNPSFGANSSFPLMARYFYVSPSVKANPDTGYVDFLELDSSAKANIARIEVEGTTPARILFHNGCYLWRDNATAIGENGVFAPKTGATLVLDSADGKIYYYHKQFTDMNVTARLGGTVVVKGVDFGFHSDGPYSQGSTTGDWNYKRFRLSAQDNVKWEHTGDLYLKMHTWLFMQDNDLLPHGPNTGRLVIEPSGTAQKYIPNQIVYSCLDLNGTTQYVNGVTTSGNGWNSGVITNTSANTGWLVLGSNDIAGTLHIHCTSRVSLKKIGTGALSVATADGEELVLEGGATTFTGTDVFTNLTVKAGVKATGAVTVLGTLTAEAGADLSLLQLSLGGAAQVSGTAEVFSLSRDGTSIDAGIYTSEDWLAADSTVKVLRKPGEAGHDIVWKGTASASASAAANWSADTTVDTALFGVYHYLMKLADADAATDTLTLDGGACRLLGMEFSVAGGFTVTTNSAADRMELAGQVTLTESAEPATRTYTVAAPVMLTETLNIAIHTNTTLRFTGGLSGTAGITITADKLSDLAMDYAETGTVELVNARISGKIDHQKGGCLVLGGDVGEPDNPSQGALECDYMRWRNNSSSANGAVIPGYLRLNGAHVHKPFTVHGVGQVDGKQNYWCMARANTTNVFEALAHLDVSTTLNGEAGSVYVFNNRVEAPGGSFNPTCMDSNNRTRFHFNGAVTVTSTSRALQPGPSHVFFKATGNRAALYYQGQSTYTEFMVDDAFDNTLFLLSGDYDELRLNSTHQTMKMLVSGIANNFVANGNVVRGKVKGVLGSVLEVTGGAIDWAATSVTNCGVKFTEGVSLVKSGTGFMRCIGPLDHSSTGSVTVTGGTLAFNADVTWTNATSVTVSGSGTLKLMDGDTFNKNVVELHLGAADDTWTIDIPQGVIQRVAFAYDNNGNLLLPGTYGNAASGADRQTYASHFTGDGTILVTRHGMRIYVR